MSNSKKSPGIIDWRGDAKLHREDDVIIAPEDAVLVEELAKAANRWTVKALETIPLATRVEFVDEERVVTAGVGVSLRQSKTKVPSNIVLTTGPMGPKAVVNPEHEDVPKTCADVRGKTNTALFHVPNEDGESPRVWVLAKGIVEKLDELVDWEKVREERLRDGGLFSFPKSEFPEFSMFGDGSRYVFWRKLVENVTILIRHEKRLGEGFTQEVQPRAYVGGDEVIFMAF
ncbi:hypothetical protein KJ632_01440 [Patescibacteria group bacterium]|nr:hypothetical protein [Patescibacteria group bacterium]